MRLGFSATRRSPEDLLTPPRMWPEDFLGRDRSPSGPVCRGPALWRWIGRVALFVMFADVALSEKPPYLESALVRCFLVSPGGRWRCLGKDGFSATER